MSPGTWASKPAPVKADGGGGAAGGGGEENAVQPPTPPRGKARGNGEQWSDKQTEALVLKVMAGAGHE